MSETLYPQALLGYRQWRLAEDGKHLLPLTNSDAWQPGLNEAYCDNRHAIALPHQAPTVYCHCGLYAWYELEQLEKKENLFRGAVLAKGSVQAHNQGFRAQAMQILALSRESKVPKEMLLKVADFYQVPLLNEKELKEYAQQKGRPVPLALRPNEHEPQNDTEAKQVLLENDGQIAIDARALLRQWGIDQETIEHFMIGVNPLRQWITAPLVNAGDLLYQETKGQYLLPIYDSAYCRVCSELVERRALARAYVKAMAYSREGKQVTDWLACPHCQASREQAAVGFLLDNNFSETHFWHDRRLPPEEGLYNYGRTAQTLDKNKTQEIVLTQSIVNTWALQLKGYNTVSLTAEVYDSLPNSSRLSMVESHRMVALAQCQIAASLANKYNVNLIYAFRGRRPANIIEKTLADCLPAGQYQSMPFNQLTSAKPQPGQGLAYKGQ